MASVEAPILVPPKATQARIEARFTLPVEGVIFQSADAEVSIERAAE